MDQTSSSERPSDNESDAQSTNHERPPIGVRGDTPATVPDVLDSFEADPADPSPYDHAARERAAIRQQLADEVDSLDDAIDALTGLVIELRDRVDALEEGHAADHEDDPETDVDARFLTGPLADRGGDA